jgi:hypothetical protein
LCQAAFGVDGTSTIPKLVTVSARHIVLREGCFALIVSCEALGTHCIWKVQYTATLTEMKTLRASLSDNNSS